MRIQKVLANEGLGSRRQIEAWITEGLLKVNGQPASLGQKLNPSDRVHFKGRLIKFGVKEEAKQLLVYHKPVGEICSRASEKGMPTIFDNLPRLYHGRWISIGRLDVNTSGLLLLTNDGDLAHRMMHPSSEFTRIYLVRAFGEVTPEIIKALKQGAELDGNWCKFASLTHQPGAGLNQTFRVSLKEGKYREVRRLFEAHGLKVNRLKRIQFGDYLLPITLRPGKFVTKLL